MDKIIEYIKEKYQPLAIIAYGSFADGSNNAHSDFDAIVVADNVEKTHDGTIVDGTVLDVFVYPQESIIENFNPENFTQIHDGNVILDTDGIAAKMKAAVDEYISNFTPKSKEENITNLEWCEKMLLRAARNDAEGFFRWHWLLIDSLEIYCDILGIRYLGPKKSIRQMKESDARGAEIYQKALSEFDYSALSEWVAYLREIFDAKA